MQKYYIILEAPLGERCGTLQFTIHNCTILGYLDILGNRNTVHGTILPDGTCSMRGKFTTFKSEYHYVADGRIEGERLSLLLRVGGRNFQMLGYADLAISQSTDQVIEQTKPDGKNHNAIL